MRWVELIRRFKSNYFWFLGGAFVGAGFNFYTNVFQFRDYPSVISYAIVSTILWILAGVCYTIVGWHIEDVDQRVQGLSEGAREAARTALFQDKKKKLSIALTLALIFSVLGFLVTWIPILQN